MKKSLVEELCQGAVDPDSQGGQIRRADLRLGIHQLFSPQIDKQKGVQYDLCMSITMEDIRVTAREGSGDVFQANKQISGEVKYYNTYCPL